MDDEKEPRSAAWRRWARTLKREVHMLYLAYRDPRTPWYGKLLAALVVAYAFSPLDLIPDPIPIIGYLDDLLLIPLGVYIAIRLIPDEVLTDARAAAEAAQAESKPVSWAGAALVVGLWLLAATAVVWLLARVLR